MRRRATGAVLAIGMGLVVMLASSPLWAPGSLIASIAHLTFRGLCHQDPVRSFALDEGVMAICHRCTGIDAGLALGALAAMLGWRVRPRNLVAWALVTGAMGAHVALGWLLPALDLAGLRVLTGLTFGAWAGAALVEALAGTAHADARHLCPTSRDHATLGAVHDVDKEIR